jgi:hypothetical protein
VVIEVGSLGRNLNPPSENDRAAIVAQLRHYLFVMGQMGYRWMDKVVGMAIIGTEVMIIKSDKTGQFRGGA